MSELLDKILEQAKELSPIEKTQLAERLLGETSVPDPEWETAWAQECQRRLKALEDGSAVSVPWEEVRRRAFGR